MESVVPALAALLVVTAVLLVRSRRGGMRGVDRARRVEEALARARDKQRTMAERGDAESPGGPPAAQDGPP